MCASSAAVCWRGSDRPKEWLCSACTFANSASKRRCTMCTMGTRPPGMGRSQPLSPRPPVDTNRDLVPEASPIGKKVRGELICAVESD